MTTTTLNTHATSPHADVEETIAPHGGTLVDRFASPDQATEIRERAPELTHITLSMRETADLDLISVGAMSPLTGFMNKADYSRTVREMRLADGTLWSLPITLSAPADTARGLKGGQDVVLVDATGRHPRHPLGRRGLRLRQGNRGAERLWNRGGGASRRRLRVQPT